jgi:pimeloyl-ACP methyl ester carboxylesterase
VSVRAVLIAFVVLGACGPRPAGSPILVERAKAPSAAKQPARGTAPLVRGPWTEELRLTEAPFDEPRAPSAIVHAPPGLDLARRPLRVVVFLHGWSGCVRVLAHEGPTGCRDGERARDGWGLLARFDAGAPNALFVLPQLAYLERDGSPGRFREPGRFRAFLEELLVALRPRLGAVTVDELAPVTLLAHSAGFETALALLARGGVEVGSVVLFDALYVGVEPFATWVAAATERRLVSLYTGTGRTARQSAMLARRARTLLPSGAVAEDASISLPEALRSHRVVVARSPVGHGAVPGRHLPEIVAGLGLGVDR